jgi:hypothetical protein
MECGQCKCWVHAKCEGLSDEKYQVLSYLPESVEFVCRLVIVLPLKKKLCIPYLHVYKLHFLTIYHQNSGASCTRNSPFAD